MRMKNAAIVSAALLISLLPQNASARKKPRQAVIGYIFAGRGGPLDGSTIAAKKMTRINYAFFGLQNGAVTSRSAYDDANLATLVALKTINPKLELVVSVGGGGEGSAGFSDMAITPEADAVSSTRPSMLSIATTWMASTSTGNIPDTRTPASSCGRRTSRPIRCC